MSGRGRRVRLRVDPVACTAHGLCHELAPELIGLDPWGYPLLDDGPVPAALLTHAERAVAACPALALRLIAVPRGAGGTGASPAAGT